jgi:ubiquinone/menaquinone biosynthesis C-methylase UbiE
VAIKASYRENIAHPNFERWKRGREVAVNRGLFLKSILEQVCSPEGKTILDIGSGIGGTALLLSENNHCISLDISLDSLKDQPKSKSLSCICADGKKLPFRAETFDIIILQDVIEHIGQAGTLLHDIFPFLKPDGVIYLSTPNRFSILNILSDPHWGIPGVALLTRSQIKKYVLPLLRSSERDREDFAALYSFRKVMNMFGQNVAYRLWTSFAVGELLNGNKGIVWSNLHLKLVKVISYRCIRSFILRCVNNNPGMINRFLTPTFYFTVKRHENF